VLSANELVQWSLGKASGPITDRDVLGSIDVSRLLLFLYAYCMTTRSKNIVEVGSNDGSLTVPLLKAAADLDGHVTSVDPIYTAEAERLVAACGYSDHWTFVQEKSVVALPTIPDASVDLVCIDGDHSCLAVAFDVTQALRILRPGGSIVLHDWSPSSCRVESWKADGVNPGVLQEVDANCPMMFNAKHKSECTQGRYAGTASDVVAETSNGVVRGVHCALALASTPVLMFPFCPNHMQPIVPSADGGFVFIQKAVGSVLSANIPVMQESILPLWSRAGYEPATIVEEKT